MNFEHDLQQLKERFFSGIKSLVEMARHRLTYNTRIIRSSSPKTILNKGFAIITQDDKIVTDPAKIHINDQVKVILKEEILLATVNKKEINESTVDL